MCQYELSNFVLFWLAGLIVFFDEKERNHNNIVVNLLSNIFLFKKSNITKYFAGKKAWMLENIVEKVDNVAMTFLPKYIVQTNNNLNNCLLFLLDVMVATFLLFKLIRKLTHKLVLSSSNVCYDEKSNVFYDEKSSRSKQSS